MKRPYSILPTALIVCVFAALSAGGATDPRSRPVKFVEYIESDTNRLAHIKTGYVPNANTEIEMEFAFSHTNLTQKAYVFGSWKYSGGRFQFSYGPDNCLFGFGGDPNYDSGITNFAYNTDRHVVKYVTGEGFYLDGTKVVSTKDGVDLVTWGGESDNLCLCACNGKGTINDDYIGPLRIYSCKIWDHGKLVRDFRPALVNGSSARLYDAAWRTFYSSGARWSGGKLVGDFVASATEVDVPTSYQKASYIEKAPYIESETNRWAYIDTKYVPNANTEIEMAFSFTTNLETKTYVFGTYGGSGKGRFQFSYGPDDAGCFLGYGGTYTNSYVIPRDNYYNTDRHVVKYVKDSGFYFDGERLVPPNVNLTSWDGTSTNLYLGAVNNNYGTLNVANNAPIRIYYCKIWEGDELKRDLVPMQRTFDHKNGLYDYVTRKFYTYYFNDDRGGFDFKAFIPPPGLLLIVR